MEKDWMMVYSTIDKFNAMYVKGILEKNNILVILFEKTENPVTDDMQRGVQELYVHWQQAEDALDFIYNLPE